MQSKKKLAAVAIAIGILLVSASLTNWWITDSNPPPYNVQAEKVYDAAFKEVESVRGVTIPQLPLIVITEAQAEQLWGQGSSAPNLAGIRHDENIYKGLFMMKENETLLQAQTDWVGAWVAVTWNNSIYVVTKYFNPYDTINAESTLVHELTHVMQGTLNIPPQAYSTFDADKARTAMTEGDAVFTQDFFTNNNKPPNLSVDYALDSTSPLQLLIPALEDAYPSLPNSVSNLDYFPYTYGSAFVGMLYNISGWNEVNQIYKNPPNSTQQILHPEDYLQGILPAQVSVPGFSQSGWVQNSTDTYGEFFIFDMLNTWLPVNESRTVAAGWRGDNLTYYENPNNDFLFEWKIAWNSSSSAANFVSTFQNVSSLAGAAKDESGVWFSNGRYLTITSNGNSTLIVCSSNESALEQADSNNGGS